MGSYRWWFLLLHILLLSPLYAQTENQQIVLESSMIRVFAQQGGMLKVDLGLSLQPFGSSTPNYSFVCFIDEKEVKTYTAADWGQLDYSRRIVFDLPLPSDIGLGEHRLEISMRRHVNGHMIEDHRLKSTFRVYKETKPRQKFLIEHFTATWCHACPATIAALEDVKKHCPNVAWVSIHCDDYYSVEGYRIFRNINDLNWYPSVYSDRRYFEELNEWRIRMAKYSDNIPSQEIADTHYPHISNSPIPSLASIQITPRYTDAIRSCQIKVDLQAVEEFEKVFGPAALTVVMVEDSIPTLHNNVLRKIITRPEGDPIQWNNNRHSQTYSVELPNNWNAQQIKVAAYIARQVVPDKAAPNMRERYVTNTEMVPIIPQGTTTSIQQASNNEPRTFQRYDAMGRKIHQPMPGLNILRYSNGRVEKLWVKGLK